MADPVSDDARLAAEIDRLKAQFPKTRELYREVCALLFFRFGITPTANRLYQLVHRGSMGTPTAVLSEFWAELREKSRVRIEHPDLPPEVREAAGELVATLWTRATAAANAALDGLRADVEAQQRDAQQSIASLQADLSRTETALEQRTSALLTAQVRVHELEQSFAAAESTRTALDDELAQQRQQARDRDAALTHAQAAEKRATLEAERERAANARLQRDAETATHALADARAELQTLHRQLGDLRYRNGTLEGQLEAMREANAAYARELNAWRDKAASTSPASHGATRRLRPVDAGKTGTGAKSAKVTAKATKTPKQGSGTPPAAKTRLKGGGSGPRSGS